MKQDDKILVAGPRGLVGSALVRRLEKEGYTNLLTPVRKDLDLLDGRADACCFLMQQPFSPEAYKNSPLYNIGTGKDITIMELAQRIKIITGFKGAIRYDPSKPDGTPRKLLDTTRISKLGWQPRISLEAGIEKTVEAYRQKAEF